MANPAPDERNGDAVAARRGTIARSSSLPVERNSARNWIPHRWPYVILIMIAAAVGSSAATRIVPDGKASAMPWRVAMLLASGVGAGAPFRAGSTASPCVLVATLAVVVLPLFLFGLGVTRSGR